MISRAAIKENAKVQLGSNIFGQVWLMATLLCFIVTAISAVASKCTKGVIVSLIAGPFAVGLSFVFLNLARGSGTVNIEDMFVNGFSKNLSRNFLVGFLANLFIALWSLLFVVPGIVKYYAYSMYPYIANDHPEYTWKQCIDESCRMTQGHKGELFVLDLSFWGWYIVGSICLGLGTFWVMSYHFAAKANYYEALKGLYYGTANFEGNTY